MTSEAPPPSYSPITAAYVIDRLAVAAAALPAMLSTPAGIEFAKPSAGIVQPFFSAFGPKLPRVRAQSLSRPFMESVIAVYSWLLHVQENAPKLRLVVALRAVPLPGRQIRTWASIGRSLRIDERQAKRLHDTAIEMILDGLNAPNQ
jgi:hypothetical protein